MVTTAAIDKPTVIGILNEHLATALDLFSQIKQAHWVVTGDTFIALHELFDRQADLLRGYVDEFGERIRALDGVPVGTVRAAAQGTRLKEFPAGEVPAANAVRTLLACFEQYSALLTDSIRRADQANDLTTQDLFIGVQREIDRNAWFLRAHLK